MNTAWQVHTGRLVLTPVAWTDLADLVRLKGDPRAYAVMLGGVRQPPAVAEELAMEMREWARAGFGIWAVRLAPDGRFVGITGLQHRPDDLGIGLRFALLPAEQGHGYASEAAGAALRFGHERAGLTRIVAAAREDNIASRTVLGAIGMRPCNGFWRSGVWIMVFVSKSGDLLNQTP